MSDYQKETAFLRQCLRFEDTAEHSELEATITRLQLNERCVSRAIWLMVLLTALAVTGLGYVRIMQFDDQQVVPLIGSLFGRMLTVLGVGSLICLMSFLALGLANRRELNERREDGRRLIAKFVKSRMGMPATPARESEGRPEQVEQDGPPGLLERAMAFQ